MSDIYKQKGFENRQAYLKSVAEEYGTHEDFVFSLAEVLGPNEDFDGLIAVIEEM